MKLEDALHVHERGPRHRGRRLEPHQRERRRGHVAEAARPDLVARVAEVNRLLADPRPFGRTRRAVGAALLREYGEAFAARTDRLRDAKADAFERQGVGGAVSRSLTGLPQSLPDLKRALGR